MKLFLLKRIKPSYAANQLNQEGRIPKARVLQEWERDRVLSELPRQVESVGPPQNYRLDET